MKITAMDSSLPFYAFQGMEKKVREQVGVQDFVLLEDYTNEDSFIANLRKRAEVDSIYVSWIFIGIIILALIIIEIIDFKTYIGQVLIAVNPYKEIPNFYSEDVMQEYRKKYFFQAPPHM